MEQYFETTTVHGFQYLHRRHALFTRIFWVCVILIGFLIACFFLEESIWAWKQEKTITTLESIATPIQKVQFPTVTVCPHEQAQPDNWSFLEKFLNALTLSGPKSEKVRSNIVENILKKLLSKLEDKYRLYPKSPFWEIIKGQDDDWTLNFPNTLTQVADLICQKKANISISRSISKIINSAHFIRHKSLKMSQLLIKQTGTNFLNFGAKSCQSCYLF